MNEDHEHVWETLRDGATGALIADVCIKCGEQREA